MNDAFTYLASSELTDVGRRRKNNEDSVLRLPGQGVFCVADGMGGVQGGEVASKATVDALRKAFTESPDASFALTAEASAALAIRAVNNASRWIKARSEERGLTGTGSTVVALAFDRTRPSKAVVLHAGDSRAYRLRDEALAQLSTDHSVAAAAGVADDKNLPAMFRGVITRAVGLDHAVLLEETPTDVRSGDLFLLCSDGLNKMVSDRHLQKLLRKHAADDVDALARLLVDEALKAGGEDNVSVVLVRVNSLPPDSGAELPPETLELERQRENPPEDVAAPARGDAESDTSQTVYTGQTVDITPTGGGATPATPMSGSGATPETPALTPAAAVEAPAAEEGPAEAPTVEAVEEARKPSRAKWLMIVLVLAAAAAAVVAGLLMVTA